MLIREIEDHTNLEATFQKSTVSDFLAYLKI